MSAINSATSGSNTAASNRAVRYSGAVPAVALSPSWVTPKGGLSITIGLAAAST